MALMPNGPLPTESLRPKRATSSLSLSSRARSTSLQTLLQNITLRQPTGNTRYLPERELPPGSETLPALLALSTCCGKPPWMPSFLASTSAHRLRSQPRPPERHWRRGYSPASRAVMSAQTWAASSTRKQGRITSMFRGKWTPIAPFISSLIAATSWQLVTVQPRHQTSVCSPRRSAMRAQMTGTSLSSCLTRMTSAPSSSAATTVAALATLAASALRPRRIARWHSSLPRCKRSRRNSAKRRRDDRQTAGSARRSGVCRAGFSPPAVRTGSASRSSALAGLPTYRQRRENLSVTPNPPFSRLTSTHRAAADQDRRPDRWRARGSNR